MEQKTTEGQSDQLPKRAIRLILESLNQPCLVCKTIKTSMIEMVCTFCDENYNMTDEGILKLYSIKNTLLENKIIEKKDLIF